MSAFPSIPLTADAFTISPSTNGNTKFTAYGLYVGGTSGQSKDINLITGKGTTVLFKAVPVGTQLRVVVSAVRTTNTSANTSLVGFGPT